LHAGNSLFHSRREQRFDDSNRIQDFQRARMHDCRAIPGQGRRVFIDDATFDVAPAQHRGEQEAGGSRADHENVNSCRTHRLPLFLDRAARLPQ
jgi:hypothetical protein